MRERTDGPGADASGPSPREIWRRSLVDGETRLGEPVPVLAAASVLGGIHVTLGLLALLVSTGAAAAVAPAETAHVVGSLTFGVGFVFLTLGRSELFTGNFLVPVSAVLAGRAPGRALARLWAVALVMNLVGVALVALLLAAPGVLPDDARTAAGQLADTVTGRGTGAAFLSAVLAGGVITVFTWLVEAAQHELTRVVVALLVGFVLLAPSLNHSVVGFGEILLGLLAGTTSAGVVDLVRTVALAAVGNVAGGLGLVTALRYVQAEGGS